jgi:hypothetical protein
MLCSLSTKLIERDLDRISELEQEIGHTLLAFSCYRSEAADLTPDQLEKVKELESQLGISLVAVDA